MKKCTDRKGITILMALLLLLVASMVSVVILTAATTAARHISNDRQSQQTYLTVSSAAELLRDDILSSGYEQKVTRRPTATGSYIERTEVTQTPYARRLYYHPEYNFQTDENPFAGGEWYKPWLPGGISEDFAKEAFRKFYKKAGGV